MNNCQLKTQHPPLTERQMGILSFIDAYRQQHGYAPSIREIGVSPASTDKLLAHSEENIDALYGHALALCGLSVCAEASYASVAMEVFSKARNMNQDAGVLSAVFRFLKSMEIVDPNRVLENIRKSLTDVN